MIRPNLKGLRRLKFLTTTDFPPFSYVDEDKRLVGFHIDLARAICQELELIEVCQIQALPFGELQQALASRRGEAVLAGVAVSASSRLVYDFSRPYFRMPARFVARKDAGLEEPLVESLSGKMIGVVHNTSHAAFARQFFDDMQVRLFSNQDAMLNALRAKKIEAAFSDALALSFWLQRRNGSVCCSFAGKPYLNEQYFGRGLAIGLAKGSPDLREGIDFALRSISDKGIFAELYLRYFPISLY